TASIISRSAGSTIARASSGSRSCSSSVEPLISAKSAVTVLRSPSRFSGAGVSATRIGESFDFFAEAAPAGAPSAMPHSPQKRLPAGLSAPHFGQRFATAAPQSPQNFLPAGFSVLQFVQRIAIILPEPKMAKYRHWAGQLKDANRDRSC